MKRDLKADLEWLKGQRTSVERELALIKNTRFYAREQKEAKKLLIIYNALEIVTRRALAEETRAIKAEALARELVDMLGRVIPCYLAGRLELDLDLVHEANGLLKKAKEVLGDEIK